MVVESSNYRSPFVVDVGSAATVGIATGLKLIPSTRVARVIGRLEQKPMKEIEKSLETKLIDRNLFIKYTDYSLLGK
jgi:hypothetical protein